MSWQPQKRDSSGYVNIHQLKYLVIKIRLATYVFILNVFFSFEGLIRLISSDEHRTSEVLINARYIFLILCNRFARCCLGTTNQNGKYIPKWPQNLQMSIKNTKINTKLSWNKQTFFIQWPSKANRNWYFWYENKPSGNPALWTHYSSGNPTRRSWNQTEHLKLDHCGGCLLFRWFSLHNFVIYISAYTYTYAHY
jgi:hypothetical protein